ncbi:hypothetical protein [Aestuariivirga litoralis]|uniref:hypothetical protein n=1 Tax=Aestuariivirga litoralis TaxID=2650924 RepID=UPI0018C45EE7|nr:hypothetical protein [Aestuariivirga litoralis]MBG1231269.1 hypothetical protein [Aestuariivirga litoralis]
MALTLVMVATIPAGGVASFGEYEGQVIPLIKDYGGTLERRLRTKDGLREMQIVTFSSMEDFEAYRGDARRLQHVHLLAASGAKNELFEMENVE